MIQVVFQVGNGVDYQFHNSNYESFSDAIYEVFRMYPNAKIMKVHRISNEVETDDRAS